MRRLILAGLIGLPLMACESFSDERTERCEALEDAEQRQQCYETLEAQRQGERNQPQPQQGEGQMPQ